MKKHLFIHLTTHLTLALISTMCFAKTETRETSTQEKSNLSGWKLHAEYKQIVNAYNRYEKEDGSKHSSSGTVNAGLIGVGASYTWTFNDQWLFFPEASLARFVENGFKMQEEATFIMASANLGRLLGPGQIYAGISSQYLVLNSELTYKPSVGLRAGYERNLSSRSAIRLGFELLTIRSENPAGGVFNQQTELRSVMIGYNFRI